MRAPDGGDALTSRESVQGIGGAPARPGSDCFPGCSAAASRPFWASTDHGSAGLLGGFAGGFASVLTGWSEAIAIAPLTNGGGLALGAGRAAVLARHTSIRLVGLVPMPA
ncbi:hypothetical protein [Streptomyces violaceus]|uniref:Uncharacterized protein n=1 Tax=Streptomyces violaceus TaxID=1936 RepID=A0ABZ1NKI9_STRVL